MNKLVLKNITKKFKDKEVIKNLNLSVGDGERISILGPSGCGKSTLLKIIAGLIDCEGMVLLNERDITNLPTNKRNIVVVDQENLLFPNMDVSENIGFGLRVRNIDKKEIKERVDELLKEINLEGYGKKKISKLSGGEKQRVALARALAVNPEVLLLDEAYSSLDTNLRTKMRELTIKLQEKHNITTILVTHDKEEAISFSHKIAVMLDGKFEQYDIAKNIYENPSNYRVARFMSDKNFLEINGKIIHIKTEDVEILKEDKREDKDLVKDNSLDNEWIMKVKILDREYRGYRILYTGEIDELKQKIVFECDKYTEYNIGQEVYIKIKRYIEYDGDTN